MLPLAKDKICTMIVIDMEILSNTYFISGKTGRNNLTTNIN